MRLITNLSVRRFRSIRDGQLEDVGPFSVLAGLNNSGKSNFLRALHLFFTGEVEPGVAFNIDRDYYRPEVRKKKRKSVEVRVGFDLPSAFKFRKGLAPVEEFVGRNFSITKRWERGATAPDILLDDDTSALSLEDAYKVQQFLSLITFRYIPNRVIPTEVIAQQQAALRDVLIRRLARYKTQSEAVFAGIRTTAAGVIGDMAESFGRMAPDISDLRLDTASSLAELVFRFGYRLQEGESEMEEEEQGSGIQSLLMLQTLHLIDRDYFQQFGWRQAAVWAIEEPESSLHSSMEAEVARFLADVMNSPSGRLQGLATTHSDLMIQYADAGYLVEKGGPRAVGEAGSVGTRLARRELLREAARFGISRWINPILYFHLEPLVLVEGRTDRVFMEEGLRFLGGALPRVASLEDLLDDPSKGGVETLKRFVHENAGAIKSRPENAPVVVVLDWDAAGKVAEMQKPFKGSDPFVALAWPAEDANPLLDESFRGIERFFSDRIIEEARKIEGLVMAEKTDGVKTIPAADRQKAKSALAAVAASGLKSTDFVYANSFLTTVTKAVSAGP